MIGDLVGCKYLIGNGASGYRIYFNLFGKGILLLIIGWSVLAGIL